MKVVVGAEPLFGVRIKDALFGEVVMRPKNGEYYLVVSPMDGSGRRMLVTFNGGTLKEVDQNEQIIPVDAAVYIGPQR